MSIAITGATGFVGVNLLEYLRASSSRSISRAELTSIESTLIKNIDAIVHLAGKAHDLKNASNPDEYYQVNFELTRKLYDAFLASDAQKFIFVSSVKAAADSVDGVLSETVSPDPKTDYGKSKLMAEQYIQSQPLPPGKSFYILRPCMIHGPGNKGNLTLLYQFVKKGIPYPLAGFDNKRSFLSIDNLCFVISEIISGNCSEPGIYNVSDDGALSTNEVVSILAASLHLKPKLWKISPTLIKFLCKVGDVLRLPLNSERLQKLTENYLVSNNKIKKSINKEFPLDAIDGLKKTAESLKKL